MDKYYDYEAQQFHMLYNINLNSMYKFKKIVDIFKNFVFLDENKNYNDTQECYCELIEVVCE